MAGAPGIPVPTGSGVDGGGSGATGTVIVPQAREGYPFRDDAVAHMMARAGERRGAGQYIDTEVHPQAADVKRQVITLGEIWKQKLKEQDEFWFELAPVSTLYAGENLPRKFVILERELSRVLPRVTPALGRTRILSSTTRRREYSMTRLSLGIMMETGFQRSPDGQALLVRQVLNLIANIKLAMGRIIMETAITHARYWHAAQRRWDPNRPAPTIDRFFSLDLDRWGVGNEVANGVATIVDRARRLMSEERVTPKMLIVPRGAILALTALNGATQFLASGVQQPLAIAKPGGAGEQALRWNGLSVHEDVVYGSSDGTPVGSLLERPQQIAGHFYVINPCRGQKAANFVPDYLTTMVTDVARDDWAPVSALDLLKHDPIWDKEGAVDGNYIKVLNIYPGVNPPSGDRGTVTPPSMWAQEGDLEGGGRGWVPVTKISDIHSDYRGTYVDDMKTLIAARAGSTNPIKYGGRNLEVGDVERLDVSRGSFTNILKGGGFLPCGWLGIRPSKVYTMGSALLVGGGEGKYMESFAGKDDLGWSVQGGNKTMLGHWTGNRGVVVHYPKRGMLLENIFGIEYVTGEETRRYFYPKSKTGMSEKYSEGSQAFNAATLGSTEPRRASLMSRSIPYTTRPRDLPPVVCLTSNFNGLFNGMPVPYDKDELNTLCEKRLEGRMFDIMWQYKESVQYTDDLYNASPEAQQEVGYNYFLQPRMQNVPVVTTQEPQRLYNHKSDRFDQEVAARGGFTIGGKTSHIRCLGTGGWTGVPADPIRVSQVGAGSGTHQAALW